MYIQLVSLHGLVRGTNVEMGRDADTGGQVRYVLELAKTLSQFPQVSAVDLFTRRIKDRRVSDDYSEEIEELTTNCRIVRLACGGPRYLRKERLWPFLDEYVNAMVAFTRARGQTPAVVHGHYADAGYVAKEVADIFDVPFIFTGHSLGIPKLDYLLGEGWTRESANKELHIDQRIRVETDCLAVADCVITSTKHERDQQYGKYDRPADLRFEVFPPGTDLDRFFPYYEYDLPHAEIDERFKQARVKMQRDLERFHFNPEKPLILSLCRPDRRKNIGALIEAYGESKELQAMANLAVFAGIRNDIETMSENEQQVLTDMLLAMDRYDLYGKMAIPKTHSSEYDVPELYRIAASHRGIFVNSAFIELFGLTAIESSATGLPFVATQDGGPQDIVENCKSGLLVDVNDRPQLTQAMIHFLTDRTAWDQASSNGVNLVREFYTWKKHVEHYLKMLNDVVATSSKPAIGQPSAAPGRRLASIDSILITDIDNTLLGDDDALERLKGILEANRDHLGFGVASGRSLPLIHEVMEQFDIPQLDVVIASVGSEIFYEGGRIADKGWASHLRAKWRPDQIREMLDVLPQLTLQTEENSQREFKVSYDLDSDAESESTLASIDTLLKNANLAHTLIFSHGTFVDILPRRASKGKAIRYLADKWNIQLGRIATAGDSGNDRDMLTGPTAGIVVSNHSEELASLKQSRHDNIFFANSACAGGIIEGLAHYGLLTRSGEHAISDA